MGKQHTSTTEIALAETGKGYLRGDKDDQSAIERIHSLIANAVSDYNAANTPEEQSKAVAFLLDFLRHVLYQSLPAETRADVGNILMELREAFLDANSGGLNKFVRRSRRTPDRRSRKHNLARACALIDVLMEKGYARIDAAKKIERCCDRVGITVPSHGFLLNWRNKVRRGGPGKEKAWVLYGMYKFAAPHLLSNKPKDYELDQFLDPRKPPPFP